MGIMKESFKVLDEYKFCSYLLKNKKDLHKNIWKYKNQLKQDISGYCIGYENQIDTVMTMMV